jgi:hypothetical protein
MSSSLADPNSTECLRKQATAVRTAALFEVTVTTALLTFIFTAADWVLLRNKYHAAI